MIHRWLRGIYYTTPHFGRQPTWSPGGAGHLRGKPCRPCLHTSTKILNQTCQIYGNCRTSQHLPMSSVPHIGPPSVIFVEGRGWRRVSRIFQILSTERNRPTKLQATNQAGSTNKSKVILFGHVARQDFEAQWQQATKYWSNPGKASI